MQSGYRISNLLPAHDTILQNDAYLILLYAMRVPPHLIIAVNGKIFTLGVRCATVGGELSALLSLIRRKNIETLFIRLALPPLFTYEHIQEEIRRCMLAYPRSDIGIATCLTPIKDFCRSIYGTDTSNVNLIFDLLPKLQERHLMKDCYYMNLRITHASDFLEIKKYEMNDVYEAIRESSLIIA